MILEQPPTIVWDIGPVKLAATGVIIIGGYIVHEFLHILPYELAGVEYDVAFNPEEKPLWFALTVGSALGIPAEGSPTIGIVSNLAPAIMLLPAAPFYYFLLVAIHTGGEISAASVLFLFAWIAVFLPSLADWAHIIRYLKILRQ